MLSFLRHFANKRSMRAVCVTELANHQKKGKGKFTEFVYRKRAVGTKQRRRAVNGGRVEDRFEIAGEYIEMNKLLKASGLCDTGGMAKAVIEAGRVEVDGSVEMRVRRKIRPGQQVAFQGHLIHVE